MSEWEARLERIETIAEVNTQQIQENSQAIRELRASAEEDREQIRENRRQAQELRAAVTALVATSERFQVNFEQIIGEIRGLRIENQRILRHLFGPETENGDR